MASTSMKKTTGVMAKKKGGLAAAFDKEVRGPKSPQLLHDKRSGIVVGKAPTFVGAPVAFRMRTIELDGVEYVVVPKAEFLTALTAPRTSANESMAKAKAEAKPKEKLADAKDYVRGAIAHSLLEARKAAGLTQVELAERLGKSQTVVSQAESGQARVGERYIKAVLKACGLPDDWKAPKR